MYNKMGRSRCNFNTKYNNMFIYSYVINRITLSLKNKIMNITSRHPKLLTFGIGLGITFAIGIALGFVDHSQAFARMCDIRAGHCV
jgi:hypothetical protein